MVRVANSCPAKSVFSFTLLLTKSLRVMVTIAEYKKALGTKANNLTDTEIERLCALSERLARALFDAWQRELREQAPPRPLQEVAVKSDV